MKYLEGLNDAQKKATLTTDGPVLVLAGAGAGKTRVLTTRMYHLIRTGVAPEKILAVTFTNKAAREMRERLGSALEGGPSPFIGTFHGLGRELLETHGRALGIPRFFTIYDREDSEKAVTSALKALDINTKEVPARMILSRISKAKGEGVDAQAFHEAHARTSFINRTTAEAWLRYEKTLREEKSLDFDDLIALPVRLLKEHAEVRAAVEDRWSHVHIDEYQDTNALQGELANLLAGKHRNLFVVGDIDQTIYTWRGATIENLLTFEESYPEAKTIVLEHNYRSTKTIVDAANRVIEKNKKRKEKISVTHNPSGEPVVLKVARNADDEALYIARTIKKLMHTGTAPEDIAILFRTNFQSRALEEGLLRTNIPYRLLGTRFYARKEVKDVLSWVKVALDPTRETDFIRAAQAPSRGIGKTTLGKLVAGKRSDLRAGEQSKVEAFEAILRTLHSASETSTPSEFVRLTIEKSGMHKALAEGGEDDFERLENIKELVTLATRHDETPGREGISAFLAEAALASDQDELDMKQERKGVTLMTVHAAKGLEFGTVFVTGMEEGLFPHEFMNDENRDEEEERRLFYVALTRAKDRVFLTLAHVRRIYGTDFLTEPSSFLSDLDPSFLVYDETRGLEDDEKVIEA